MFSFKRRRSRGGSTSDGSHDILHYRPKPNNSVKGQIGLPANVGEIQEAMKESKNSTTSGAINVGKTNDLLHYSRSVSPYSGTGQQVFGSLNEFPSPVIQYNQSAAPDFDQHDITIQRPAFGWCKAERGKVDRSVRSEWSKPHGEMIANWPTENGWVPQVDQGNQQPSSRSGHLHNSMNNHQPSFKHHYPTHNDLMDTRYNKQLGSTEDRVYAQAFIGRSLSSSASESMTVPNTDNNNEKVEQPLHFNIKQRRPPPEIPVVSCQHSETVDSDYENFGFLHYANAGYMLSSPTPSEAPIVPPRMKKKTSKTQKGSRESIDNEIDSDLCLANELPKHPPRQAQLRPHEIDLSKNFGNACASVSVSGSEDFDVCHEAIRRTLGPQVDSWISLHDYFKDIKPPPIEALRNLRMTMTDHGQIDIGGNTRSHVKSLNTKCGGLMFSCGVETELEEPKVSWLSRLCWGGSFGSLHMKTKGSPKTNLRKLEGHSRASLYEDEVSRHDVVGQSRMNSQLQPSRSSSAAELDDILSVTVSTPL